MRPEKAAQSQLEQVNDCGSISLTRRDMIIETFFPPGKIPNSMAQVQVNHHLAGDP